MRPTTDLLDLEFIFSQQARLMPRELQREYKHRVLHSELHLSRWEQLEALHQVGALVPMYRFVKNVRSILANARQNNVAGVPLGLLSLNAHFDSSMGSLVDPHTEPYRSWYSYISEREGHVCWKSSFFYSRYQLLLVPMLRTLMPKMRGRRTSRKHSSIGISYRLKLDERTRTYVEKKTTANTELILALTALETRYLPELRGHRHLVRHIGLDADAMNAYQRSFDPVSMLSWIGWDVKRIRDTAERLLRVADSIDPLRDWYELVGLCHPDKWEKLRGDALVALDHRIAAEILLRFYEDLVRVSAAPPFKPIPKLIRGPRDRRLRSDPQRLDAVLMDFGISPQPSLVLVLEGETERRLVPRVMDSLGILRHRSFVEIFKGEGVDTDFGLLATYVAVPALGEPLRNSVLLTRPPTKFLVVIDAEKKFETPGMREDQRKKWASRIHKAVPEQYRTPTLLNEILSLISVETWKNDHVFEFAHFTDEEIARAMIDVYRASQGSLASLLTTLKVSSETHLLSKLQAMVGNMRPNGNIEHLSKGWDYPPTKTAIAEALWPILENRIQDAISQGTHEAIPVVRVLVHAWRAAVMLRRANVVIPY